MPPYTLGQAAKATGKQKSTILDAIKSGRLSASRDDKRQWQIDPAELHRVYPPTAPNVATEREETAPNAAEMRHLQEKIGFLEQHVKTLETVAADLRTDRDQWREQARLALLTHQPANQNQKPPAAIRSALWVALAAAASVAAVAWFWSWESIGN